VTEPTVIADTRKTVKQLLLIICALFLNILIKSEIKS